METVVITSAGEVAPSYDGDEACIFNRMDSDVGIGPLPGWQKVFYKNCSGRKSEPEWSTPDTVDVDGASSGHRGMGLVDWKYPRSQDFECGSELGIIEKTWLKLRSAIK
jgi:hypothetical protein